MQMVRVALALRTARDGMRGWESRRGRMRRMRMRRMRMLMVALAIAMVGMFGVSKLIFVTNVHAYTAGTTATPGGVYAWGLDSSGQLGATATQSCGGNPCGTAPAPVSALASARAVAAGGPFSLAVTSDGAVWAWGDNGQGELGPGAPAGASSSVNPVQVTGLPAGVTTVAAGGFHGLALASDGTVWAWGAGYEGQLGPAVGSGPTAQSAMPVQVTGLPVPVVAIAAGGSDSLALTADGTVWAWGDNASGQLGQTTTTLCGASACSSVPVRVPGLSGVTAIASGGNYNLALTASGLVYAWGDNSGGTLGNGATTNSTSPVQVSSLSNVSLIAAGDHALAMTTTGAVYAWGADSFSELGSAPPFGVCSNQSCDTTPVQVTGLPANVTALAVGSSFSLALTADHSVYSWGMNVVGNLGIGTSDTDAHPLPVPLGTLNGVTAVAAGNNHALAIANPAATTGTAPIASLSASTFTYPSQQIGTASDPQTTTLTNTGTAPLTITGAVLGGANPGDFTLAAGTCVPNPTGPISLPPGGSCTMRSSFAPTAIGTRTASLTVTCDAANCPLNGTVMGTGINPVLSLNPTSISFGDQPAGTTSGPRSLSIANGGTTNLTVSSIGFGGADAAEFTYSGPALPLTVVPGANVVLSVFFAPKSGAVGTQLGSLTIGGNDSLRPNVVTMTGNAVLPADVAVTLSASPSPVRSGAQLTYTIAISNNGTAGASNIQLTNAVPANATFSRVTTTSGSCTAPAVGNTGTVTCGVSSLAAGAGFTVTLIVTVKAPTGTIISDTASITAGSFDPNTANNSATVTTTVAKR